MLDVSDRLANQFNQAGAAPRRTFAIISHPDAGKTTLTEKLLLFGGAIQLAGEVKARGDRRRGRPGWVAGGGERGVSGSSRGKRVLEGGAASTFLSPPGTPRFTGAKPTPPPPR